MRQDVGTILAVLAIAFAVPGPGAALAAGIPDVPARTAACLDHQRLLSRAAYRPDALSAGGRCGHLLSTETVVGPRPADRT